MIVHTVITQRLPGVHPVVKGRMIVPRAEPNQIDSHNQVLRSETRVREDYVRERVEEDTAR